MSTRSTAALLFAFGLAVGLGGCDSASEEADPTWVDLGTIAGVEDVTAVAVAGEDVLVGTSRGVWRRPLEGGTGWVRSGLDTLYVKTMRVLTDGTLSGGAGAVVAGVHPMGSAEQVPFHRSTDGGRTWTGSGEGLLDPFSGAYVSLEDIVAQPGTAGAVLYASLEGPAIVRSRNGGQSWEAVQGVLDTFGYPCLLHIAASDPTTLYQGCESPLDFSWIRAYDIMNASQATLGDGEELVGIEEISNRRTNSLTSFGTTDEAIYAGLEGAVIALEGDEWRWVWKKEDGEDTGAGEAPVGYTYVTFFWIDPSDPDHMLFGGGDGPADETTRSGFHETFDGGETVTPVEGPAGVDFNVGGVRAGTTLNGGRDVLVAALTPAGARILLLENASR